MISGVREIVGKVRVSSGIGRGRCEIAVMMNWVEIQPTGEVIGIRMISHDDMRVFGDQDKNNKMASCGRWAFRLL